MTMGLTLHQARVLRFVTGYLRAHGYGPSIREISAGIGLSEISRSAVQASLVALEERGRIRRLARRSRAIEVLKPLPIPYAPDGAPLYAVPIATMGEARA